MIEPSKEQQEEFWEWCGFHKREPEISLDWWQPDGYYWGSSLSPIDLNSGK